MKKLRLIDKYLPSLPRVERQPHGSKRFFVTSLTPTTRDEIAKLLAQIERMWSGQLANKNNKSSEA
jgi:hypothetical protein